MSNPQSNKAKPSVYVETSVISYLVARPSRDALLLVHQQITQDFWRQRTRYQIFTSDAVLAEASAGHANMARQRLEICLQTQQLQSSHQAQQIAQHLIQELALPAKAKVDATHIAIASLYEMQYLLTWNCKHTLPTRKPTPSFTAH
jgi:hypothetical protein